MIDAQSLISTIGSKCSSLRDDSTLKDHPSDDCVFKTHSNSILTLAQGQTSKLMWSLYCLISLSLESGPGVDTLTGSGNVHTKQSPSITAVGTTGSSSRISLPPNDTFPAWNKSNSRALTGDCTRSLIRKDCTSDGLACFHLRVNRPQLLFGLHVDRNSLAVESCGQFDQRFL